MPHIPGRVRPDNPDKVSKVRLTISADFMGKIGKNDKSILKNPHTGVEPSDIEIVGAAITTAAVVPTVYNLSAPTPLTQLFGECVSFAQVYGMRSIEQYYNTGASSYSNQVNVFSQEFVYNQTKFGDCGSGTSMEVVLNFLQSVGVCLYATMPYDGICSAIPNQVQFNEASKYKIGSYSRILFTDRSAMKSIISQNHPLSVSILADNNFVSGTSSTLGSQFIWSAANHTAGNLPHNIAIVGYDDSKNAYKVMNSWGTGWGIGGFAYIDYDFFESGVMMAGNGWVYYITSLNNSTGGIAPTANAGVNQTIQLPTSQVSLVGTGTDPDGTIVSYTWTLVSGPNTPTITTPTSSSTTVTGLIAGTYQFKLTVVDSQGLTGSSIVTITVNAANQPPIANAGTDKAVTLPTSSVTLTGSGSDPDGTITAYLWSRVSGPNTPTIVTPTAATTSVTGLIAGTYVFRLTVTDNQSATGFDDVNVVVSVSANLPPTANAGADQTIQLPTSQVSLFGSGTDPDGTIASYLWTQVSGTAASITTPATANTTVTGLVAGTYQFKLTVTDNGGLQGSGIVVITVNPANQPPIVNAGTDQSITSAVSSTALSGSASDPDGTIASHVWTQVSGNACTIVSPNSYATSVTGLVVGTYVFRLTATDNQGLTGDDDMTVTVALATIAPVANAGSDQSIPVGATAVLDGSASYDPDGIIASWLWAYVSGPTSPTIVNSTAAVATVVITTAGAYTYKLTVTDNDGNSKSDLVNISVVASAVDNITLTVSKKNFRGKTTDTLVWNISLAEPPLSAELQISTVAGNDNFSTFWNIQPYVPIGQYPYTSGIKAKRYYRVKATKSDGTFIYSNIFDIR